MSTSGSEKVYTKVDNSKSRMCFKVLKGEYCEKEGDCTFAHTVQELRPIRCGYDSRCRNGEKCQFFHSRDTLESYAKKITGIDAPKIPPPVPKPAEREKMMEIEGDLTVSFADNSDDEVEDEVEEVRKKLTVMTLEEHKIEQLVNGEHYNDDIHLQEIKELEQVSIATIVVKKENLARVCEELSKLTFKFKIIVE